MNILYPFLLALVFFAAAYRFYRRYLSTRLGLNSERKTPAVDESDRVDFIPERLPVPG
jgi:carbon starvation protein CstA